MPKEGRLAPVIRNERWVVDRVACETEAYVERCSAGFRSLVCASLGSNNGRSRAPRVPTSRGASVDNVSPTTKHQMLQVGRQIVYMK